MGGSYNYQTTACTGVRSRGTTPGPSGGGESWPAQHWYCQARARNGASGWGRYGEEAASRQRALAECQSYSRGQACRITSCRYIGGTPPAPSPSAPDVSTAPPPPASAPPFQPFRPAGPVCGGRRCLPDQICGPTGKCYNPSLQYYCGTTRCVKGRQYPPRSACGRCAAEERPQAAPSVPFSPFPFTAYTCERCYRKLKNDLRFGLLTQRPRSYIAEAIAAYDNCKLKATGSCQAGDLFRRGLPACGNPGFNDEGMRTCISNALKNDPGP